MALATHRLAQTADRKGLCADAAATSAVDGFGCSASKLITDQQLHSEGIKFFRKVAVERLGAVSTNGDDRGFLIGVSQASGHRRRIFHPRHATSHVFVRDAIYIRNLWDDYRADMHGGFDFVLMEISRSFLVAITEDEGQAADVNLVCGAGHIDGALARMVNVVLPLMTQKRPVDRLFMDQLNNAIGAYLLRRYRGRASGSSQRVSASRWQMSRAMEMLQANLDGDVLISDIASACGLSRGYFIRAFKEQTGTTPYQWLLSRRMERARGLLRESQMPLSDIALACGFSDQSHFTRLFSRINGVSPGNWRRQIGD